MNTEVVSDVLRTVRLTGAIFFELEASSPWAAEAPATPDHRHLILPGSQHVIEYHVVLEGGCWATCLGEGADPAPVELGPGSVLVLPHGDAHVLSSAPGMRGEPVVASEVYRQPGADERLPWALRIGGNGPETARIICGFLGCDARPFNPLIAALPRMLHAPAAASGQDGWLRALVQATVEESRSRRLAGGSVLQRLSELIFIEVIRRYVEDLPPDAAGWLAALADPQVGRVLALLHDDPARPWTLAELARRAAVSRSVLAQRFAAAVGQPPMTYLQSWRMQIAESLLLGGSAPIARIAAEVGYDSEAAFSRAFKRCTGLSPAARRIAATA